MIFAPLPPDEIKRLEAIEEYDLRSMDLQDELQTIATLAASSLKMPMVFITIVDRDLTLIKAKIGSAARELDRRRSICSHTILNDQLLEVQDLKTDLRFYDAAKIMANRSAQFYAGLSLKLSNGARVGTLCVFDIQPRKLTLDEKIVLQNLAKIIVSFFESRKRYQLSSERESYSADNATDAIQKLGARTDYLAFITHELRTPISGIISITNALFETEIQPSQREHLTTILQSGRHLMGLTNDILDFAKIEAGKMSVKLDEFDLEALIRQTLRTFHFAALNKNVRLELDLEGALSPTYFSDTQRIAQILTNLVGNALKFTDQGGVKVTVRVVPLSFEKHQILIRVTDSGIGMDVEAQKNLFQLYSQADSSIQKRFGGTGLGLAISRSLAQLLNGELTCVSEVGVGSTFTLELQLDLKMPIEVQTEMITAGTQDNSLVRDASQPEEFAAKNRLSVPFGALRILVAEDNEISQKVIAAMLKKSGCRFQIVGDGESAVNAFRDSHFDVVLLDSHMPKLNGFQAARQIRDIALLRDIHTPILGVSASSRTKDDPSYAAAGMDDTIEKPFTQDALHAKIVSWISLALEAPAA